MPIIIKKAATVSGIMNKAEDVRNSASMTQMDQAVVSIKDLSNKLDEIAGDLNKTPEFFKTK